MSLQVEKLENNMAKLTIEVPAEELEKAIEGAYLKNRGRISIPGFRKGKAPRKMIEQIYGKEVFYEDAANDLIPDAYEKAYDECEEEIVSSPQIDVVQLEAGKPFIFTADGPKPAFAVYEMGCAVRGKENFGTELGIMLESEIPQFLAELGKEISKRGMEYQEFVEKEHEEFLKIAGKYL